MEGNDQQKDCTKAISFLGNVLEKPIYPFWKKAFYLLSAFFNLKKTKNRIYGFHSLHDIPCYSCLLTFINENIAVPERFFAPRYITYSKEEEAIRCIKNVHGFVLEGRPLRYLHRDLLKLFMYG